MKPTLIKLLSASLALLLLLSGLVACSSASDTPTDTGASVDTKGPSDTNASADTKGPSDTNASADTGTAPESSLTPSESVGETETGDAISDALNALGEIDYGKKTFTILHQDTFKNEVYGENIIMGSDGGNSQVINDAVYLRNQQLEERCNLKMSFISRNYVELASVVRTEMMSPTNSFQLVDTYIFNNAALAIEGALEGLGTMGMDLEGEWWDKGTADFSIHGDAYFMCGSLNTGDDQVTYVLIFNKKMREDYAASVANPYTTVRNKEWTLDYFNQIIQGISSDNDGKQGWTDKDTYGFVTTWEYGTTLFIGSDLRYILNDATTESPTLFLAEKGRMDKALSVIDLSQRIYHDNNATYMSPPGQENLGTNAFKENRALFFGDTCLYLGEFTANMDGEYGVLPVPKYDQAQEFYRTWTHPSGSSFSVPSSIPAEDSTVIGQIFSAYAILSHQHLKPAYYDTVLSTRNIQDADSAEMLDILFQNRVYDMAFYFDDFGFTELVKNAVNEDKDSFSSSYKRVSSRFDQKLDKLFGKLEG